MLVSILNGLIEVLYAIAWALTALLPNTPFDFSNLNWGVFGDAIGIVFPVASMGVHMTVILGAFAMYYAIRWILRIIRQVQ